MGTANLEKYRRIENLIRKVGVRNLNQFLIKEGHKPQNLERNMRILRYCFQHGPIAAAKLYHISQSYPTQIIKCYEDAAKRLLARMEMEKKDMLDEPICPVCKSPCSTFKLDINGEICGCENCTSERDAYEYLLENMELEKDYHDELNWEIEREGTFTNGEE